MEKLDLKSIVERLEVSTCQQQVAALCAGTREMRFLFSVFPIFHLLLSFSVNGDTSQGRGARAEGRFGERLISGVLDMLV